MSAGEVAAALGTSPTWVYRYVNDGVLKATKGARKLFFDPEDVLTFGSKANRK